jgi:hypothetical protein
MPRLSACRNRYQRGALSIFNLNLSTGIARVADMVKAG